MNPSRRIIFWMFGAFLTAGADTTVTAQLYTCNRPALTSSPLSNLGLVGLVTAGSPVHSTAQSTCDLLTEKGPRAVSLYKHCPNNACQGGLEFLGVGIIASVENNLRSKMTSQVGNSWFGFQARTGVTSVTSDRQSLSGWQRLQLQFLGAVLPLPVHRFQVNRVDGPLNLQQTYGVRFHTMRWAWDRRTVHLSADIPTTIGNATIVLDNLDGDSATEFASREDFYRTITASTIGDASDWDWYVSPSGYWSRLALRTKWGIEFQSPRIGKNLGFAEASLRGFVRGAITGYLHHEEKHAWSPVPDASLPHDVYRRAGTLSTANMEQSSADLTGGIKLALRAGWYEWKEEWTLPTVSTSGPATWTGTRTTARFEVLFGDKRASAYPLTACSTNPPAPVVPDWIRLTSGSHRFRHRMTTPTAISRRLQHRLARSLRTHLSSAPWCR